KILEEHPQSSTCPQALLGVARCQGLQGEWSEAQKSYEEILSRYPLSEEKGIAEIMLQRLRAQARL
ncbi:MAG: tetratricopeptide repeat protein, partial [bacterium]